MIVALNQAQVMHQHDEEDARLDKESIAKVPDQFKTASSWKVFSEAFETYLGQMLGSDRIPLPYVIRKTAYPDPGKLYTTQQEQSIVLAPLQGTAYNRDNMQVYGLIKQLVLEGPGRSYILPYDNTADGHSAWMALVNHFEGDGFHNRNVEDAYRTLEHLFYEGERKGFNFEKFIERHMECYLELARHNEPVNEQKKVRDFLGRIKASELQAAVQQVRVTANLSASFMEAANLITLSVVPLKQNQRNIGALNTQDASRRGGRGGGRRQHGRADAGGCHPSNCGGRGRSQRSRGQGRTPGHGTTHTGYNTASEWHLLSADERTKVLEARGTKRSINSIEISVQGDDVASAITEPTRAACNNTDVNPASSNNSGTSGAGTQFGRRSIGGVYSRNYRHATNVQISQTRVRQGSLEGTYGTVELEIHADTACLGKNFRVIAMDRVCEVSPYHPDYPPLMDAPVVQAATAFDDPDSSETFMLVINQGLYLGKVLVNSLLNPDQLQAHGVIIDDIPKHSAPDPDKATHSICVPSEDFKIPLSLQGVVSVFHSRHPTVHELETCKWVVLTSDRDWNPNSEELAENEAHWECASLTISPLELERSIYAL